MTAPGGDAGSAPGVEARPAAAVTPALAGAVVFDCDGTLADSEPLARRAWEVVLTRYGHTLTEAEFAAMVGRSYQQAHAIAAAGRRLPGRQSLWAELAETLFGLIETELRPFEDAVASVRLLASLGVPLAVASSSPRARLDRTLAALGLSGAFAATVAGDEVANAKPAPDLFLVAAERLGVPAARCLAIEDSPVGVAAAKAAGMRTIAVCRDGTPRHALAAADLVVERLDPAALARAAGRPAPTP